LPPVEGNRGEDGGPEFEAQMNIAREGMSKFRNTLGRLAK